MRALWRLTLAGLLVLPVPAAAAPAAGAVGAVGALERAGCRSGTVSLTFDDGPSPSVTPRLVGTLRDLHVPATFFMVGSRVDAAPAVVRAVERAGFLVANHSYDHARMTSQSTDAVVDTLRRTDAELRRAGVHPSGLMRPPYGAVDGRVRAAARQAGDVPVLWDVDSRDWQGGSTGQIVASIIGQLRPGRGNVVLQHDGVANSPASVAAVPEVVREARRRGYCFVALDERGRPGFPTPTVSVARVPASVREGRPVRVALALDRPTARRTTVRVGLGDRRVTAAFAPGAVRTTVRVPTTGDRLDAPDARYRVHLTRAVRLRRDRGRGPTVVVRDDDAPPSLAGTTTAVREPASGSVLVPVRFRLDRPSGRAVTLVVRTTPRPGPGQADHADVTPVDQRVVVPAGRTVVSVAVRVLADGVEEPEERLEVTVVAATGARTGTPAVLTILPPLEPPPSPPRRTVG